jgi:antitoxin MazE
MKAAIIKVGNSRGIRIPKPVFEQCGFEDEVEMEVRDNTLVIRSPHQVREGWTEAFKSMANHGDEKMPIEMEELSSIWDKAEWEWK